ncbi:hypothetical protein D3C78_1562330 [compost metagenome]
MAPISATVVQLVTTALAVICKSRVKAVMNWVMAPTVATWVMAAMPALAMALTWNWTVVMAAVTLAVTLTVRAMTSTWVTALMLATLTQVTIWIWAMVRMLATTPLAITSIPTR